MARYTFREIKPLKFREVVPDTAPDEPEKFPDLMDLAAPTPPPEPEIPFGAQAVQRAGRIDELRAAEPPPAPHPGMNLPPAPIPGLPEADVRQKGPGFLGSLQRPDGRVSTELSITTDWGEGDTEIPSLVPGLTQEEIDQLLTIADPKKIPQGTVDKAVAHAQKRIAAGLSPFAQGGGVDTPAVDVPAFVPAMPSVTDEPEGAEDLRSTLDRLGQMAGDFGRDVAKEFRDIGNLSGAEVNAGLASFSRSSDQIATMFAETDTMQALGMKKGDIFKIAEEEYKRGEKYWRDKVKDPSLMAEIMGSFLGGIIPAVGEFMLNVPWFFLRGTAVGGVKEGVRQAMHRYILGAILHQAGLLKIPSRTITTGSIGALDVAAQGGTKEDIAKGFGVMALVGLTMGPGRIGIAEALKDAPFGVMEDVRAFEADIFNRVRTHLINTKEVGLVDAQQISEWYSTKLAQYDAMLRDPRGRPIGELRAAADTFKAVTGQQHPLDPDLTGHDPLRQIPDEATRFPERPRIFARPFKFIEVGQVTPIEPAAEAPPPEGEGFVMVEPEPVGIPKVGERPTEVKQPTEPILSKDVTPFKTERGAEANIPKARKAHPAIKDWTVVPVGDGFGLMPRHQVAWQQTLEEYTERFYLQGRRFEDIADEEFERILNESPGMSDFFDPKTTNYKLAVRRYIDDRIELQQEFGGILRKEHPFEKRKDGTARIQTTTMKHYREVAKAIKAGLPVPPEVTDPYPSLQGKLVPEGVIAPDEALPPEIDEIAEILPGLLEEGRTAALADLVDIPPGYPEPIIVDATTIRTGFYNEPTSLLLEQIYTDAGFVKVKEDVNKDQEIDLTFEWPEAEEVIEALPHFAIGDTVQTPDGVGEITTITATQAGVRLADGTAEIFELGDLSTPVEAEEPKEPAEEPELEIEPVAPVEAEAPIEEAPLAAPIGFDSKGKALRPGDAVKFESRYPGERLEIVGKHPSRKDIFKVKKVGQTREYNAHSKELIKIIPKMVKPARGPQKTWKTLIGWFRLNPIWDKTLPGETSQFHVGNSGIPGLVSEANGLPWDELETKAKEDGILTEGQDWQDLMRMLNDEIAKVAEGKKGSIVGDINITAQEKQMDLELEADEEAWIAEQSTKVEEVSMNQLDLQVGDRLNMPTPEGDSEWWQVTEVAKDGRVTIKNPDGIGKYILIFDPVELVGGEGYGVDRQSLRPRPGRKSLTIEDDQIIPALNSLEAKLIKILSDDKELNHAIVKVDENQSKIIDKELWLSKESQLRYGLGSKYDKVKWSIALVKGDAAGNRVYDIQRPYGYLSFDYENNTLSLFPSYEELIDPSIVIEVMQDVDKERITKTTIMKDVLNQQPNRTIPNELLQNAFDAMPDDRPWDQKVVKYRVDGRYIDGKQATVVTFEDNGWGMSADIFAYKYLKIGAKGKESDVAMGGFGKANAVLLNYPNSIKVVTTAWVRENTKLAKDNPARYERGQTKKGKVHRDAVKMQVALDVTQQQLYDSLAEKATMPMVIDEVDRDTPTGTFYEATYTDTNENDYLKVRADELEEGFGKYVQTLRSKAVVIQEGTAGDPDNIVHTKDFDDLLPEELKTPKITLKVMGSDVDVYFLNTGKYGAYPMFGKYRIAQHFYNKGLPLQIPSDNIGNVLRVPFEPDFKLYVNWKVTPKVEHDNYPFIKNRTEVLNEAGNKIAVEINKTIKKWIDEYMEGQQEDFDQAMKQSVELEGVTVFLPYRDPADVKTARNEVNKHKKMFTDFAKVANSFNKFLEEVGLPTVNFVITIDPRLHGFKTNPEVTDQELYAINWFSMTKDYTQKERFKNAVAAGEDPLRLKGSNVATTKLHEYTHKFEKGHDKDYAGTFDELLTIFDPYRLSLVSEEAHDIYKQYDKRIESLEETFKELGKGGLLIDTGSSRNLGAEHESGTVKGSSATSPVVGSYSQSRIQYDLFGEHQKIEAGEEPLSPEDLIKKSFPDASPAQIKAMLKDPKLRKQVAQGSISSALAEEISKKYNLARSVTQIEMFPKEAKGQGDLFDLSRKDVGEDLDDYAEEELGPEAGVFVFKAKGKPEGTAFESAEEVVQERVEASRGKRIETLAEAFERKKRDLLNKAFREFQHLPKNKEFAELRSALLKLQKQKGLTSMKMTQKLKEVTKDLNKTDETDFAWKVILDDLMEEVGLQRERGTPEDDIGLPYNYTPETLEVDHIALNRHIDGNAEISAALQRRKDMWNNLRSDYTRAMKVIGFDVSKHLTRDFYFRHQVLHYVNVMGLFGSGERLRTPSYRSHLRPRTGASPDINADYLQAESEVVAQMMYDIEIARTIDAVNRHYNIQDELKGRALDINDTKMLQFFQELVSTLEVPPDKEPPTAEDLYKQVLNKKMAIGFDKLGQHAALGELPVGKEYEWEWLTVELADNWLENKAIKKELGKEWTNADRVVLGNRAADALIKYAAWILKEHGGEPGSGAAATIFKGMNEKRKIIQETLGKEYLEWRDMIPEGYTTWQPWEGTTFFMAHSVPETIAKQLLENELEQIGITKDDLRKALTRGGRRREYVVKQEVADTLNELSTPRVRGSLGNVHAYAIKRWKIWQLVSPRRFGKYNFRNLTGDAEAAWLGSPAIFKHTKVAFNELYQVFVEGKDPATVSKELNDWLERGGWGATLQAQEMGEFDFTKSFLKRHEKTGVMGIPSKAWDAYWKTARISTDFREALLRYAAYREAMRMMEASPDGMPTNYWASIRNEIQGLSDMRDRAYFMSNDLLGAYDRVSALGQELRERWFPFWSWKAVNFVRYVRLFQNAAHDGEFTKKLGYKAVGTAAKTPFIAMRIGKMILKMLALQAITFAIANTLFPREEDDLPEEIKGRPHLTFGRDSDGNVQYFPRIGATSDNLEWVGLDATPYYVNQYMRGRMTLPEIAKEMAKSPLNVVIQGGIPFIKLGAELLTRRALFPDAFSPRTVRDRGLHLFRAFGLDNEYLAISGKPSRPYYKSLKGTLIYTIDPFQAGYRDTMDQKTRFMSKIGKLSEGFHLTDRGNALYHARLAMRYNDYDATIKYMAEYLNFGGTLRGLKQSLNNMHPLSGLNAAEKVEFVASLDAEGLAKFVRAVKYWEELVTVAPPEEKRRLRLLK